MLGAAALASPSALAQGESWPAKPIRAIVPFAPGGGVDVVARILCGRLEVLLGQPLVVENKGGAGSILGTEQMAKAAPDGYTIGFTTVASHTINPMLYRKLPYNPDKDLITIRLVALLSNLLVVTPKLPVNDVAGLIALCKKEPGKYFFASPGQGTSPHLSGELFKTMAGIDLVHVPYKGGGAIFGDLTAGTVQVMFGNMPSVLPQARDGRLKGLGVTSLDRSKSAPEIPAIAETLPGYVATSWYGVAAPAGTPSVIIEKLDGALAKVLEQPDIQQRWHTEFGLDIPNVGRADFDSFLALDRRRWEPAVRASGVKLD
jgi:tripartite-type tricarboxylate transporter receptor subunit TctC